MAVSYSFTVLGSSSGAPQAERATAGYLLKTGDSLSLVDCGGGVASSFLKRGYQPTDVDRIFISHTHPDHVGELPLFIQMIYLAGRKKSLDIYLPAEFVKPFDRFMPAMYLIREKLPFEINLTGYESGFAYDADFRLTATGNNHLRGYADLLARLDLPNRMQCHCFNIVAGGKSIFYSSDILSFADVRDHLDGHDYVFLETTHIDLEEFLDFAHEIRVGRYIMTHLGTPEEIATISALAEKYGIDNLAMAADGMEIVWEA
ncbi:MAG: MBL fold metallo-hydrolase [candidate division Zixibacteria bacterium]|nr:MBL fold metallo-hydrolase [candidate division Zixibacteria bacterium]